MATSPQATTDNAEAQEGAAGVGTNKSSRFQYTDPSTESDWINQSFLLPTGSYDDEMYMVNRFASSADTTFVDSSPGGGIGCNVKPQYTPTADIRRKGRPFNRPRFTITAVHSGTGFGAGRVWNEYIHDVSQRIYVRCGVPEFNSLANFLRKAFTYEEITIARRGVAPSWLYTAMKVAGSYVFARAFPIATMAIIVLKGLDFLLSRPNNKYCTLKPTMHQYWGMVNTLTNTWAVNRGIMPKILKPNVTDVIGRPYMIDPNVVDAYATMFPGFFVTDNITPTQTGVEGWSDSAKYYYIDVFAMANRAQRVANIAFATEFEQTTAAKDGSVKISSETEFMGFIRSRDEVQAKELNSPYTNNGNHTLRAYLNSMMFTDSALAKSSGWIDDTSNVVEMANRAEISRRVNNVTTGEQGKKYNFGDAGAYAEEGSAERAAGVAVANQTTQDNLKAVTDAIAVNAPTITQLDEGHASALKQSMTTAAETAKEQNSALKEPKYYDKNSSNASWWSKMAESLDAEFRNGSGYAVFCVDNTGPVTESFSANYGESMLSSRLNEMSSKAKQFRFSMADGNIFGTGNVVGDTVRGFVNAVGDVVGGAAEAVTLGASNLLLGLAGSGYIDIPKHWLNSEADVPAMNYSMTLISPYGNAMSQLQNIYIPLFMALAQIVPRATGRSSYTYPFITSIYDRGRNQTQYGAMRSLSVTRGTSNLPFTSDGKALAIDLTFSYVDLTGVTNMPVTGGVDTDLFSGAGIDDDNRISDYLAVLAGQDLYSQVYAVPRAMTRLAKVASKLGNATSPAWMASMAHDKLINGAGLFNLTKPFVRLYEMGVTSNNAAVGAGGVLGSTAPN